MGIFSRLLIPRGVRRAAHPGRAVKRAVTPRSMKHARRALHPVANARYSVERSAATTLRSKRTPRAQVWHHGSCSVNHRAPRQPLAVATDNWFSNLRTVPNASRCCLGRRWPLRFQLYHLLHGRPQDSTRLRSSNCRSSSSESSQQVQRSSEGPSAAGPWWGAPLWWARQSSWLSRATQSSLSDAQLWLSPPSMAVT